MTLTPGTATATVPSNLSFITKDSVDILSENYPSLRQQLFRFSKVRSRRAMWKDQEKPASATRPSDDQTHGKDTCDGDGVVDGKEPAVHDGIQAGSKMIVVKPQSSMAGRVVTVIDANWHGMVKVRAHTRSRMVQP